MKPYTSKSAVVTFRCIHRASGGRQCRHSAVDAQYGLCQLHRAEKLQMESADHYDYLIRNFQRFQTAQGINYSLGNLYQLLAQNRISPRRAAVLSYISSLLLRTLPQIDADQAAGIIDPTKPPIDISPEEDDSEGDSESDAAGDDESSEFDPDSDSDPDEDSETESDSEIKSDADSETEADSEIEMVAVPDATDASNPSFPEPDPKKKPS